MHCVAGMNCLYIQSTCRCGWLKAFGVVQSLNTNRTSPQELGPSSPENVFKGLHEIVLIVFEIQFQKACFLKKKKFKVFLQKGNLSFCLVVITVL